MPRPRQDIQLIDLWRAALEVEVGLFIKTDDRKLMQQHLYRARSEQGTVEMQDIALCVPDIDDELWLVKRSALEEGNA